MPRLQRGNAMSENQEDNILEFKSKSQLRRIAKEQGKEMPVTDEEFEIFMKALLGPYKGGGYNPE